MDYRLQPPDPDYGCQVETSSVIGYDRHDHEVEAWAECGIQDEDGETIGGLFRCTAHVEIYRAEQEYDIARYRRGWADMPPDYTCGCGLYVLPPHRNPEAIHISDCPYRPGAEED